MKKPSREVLQQVYELWIQHIAPKDFIHDQWNADLVNDYIQSEKGGEFNYANMTAAVDNFHVSNRLHRKPQSLTAAEIAAKAAAEKKAKEAAAQEQVVKVWLDRHCPTGLKGANGEPYPGDVDRIVAFVVRNYGGQVTIESLNASIRGLENVLTWFSPDPADRQIRNLPPAPPRKLSRQAQIDAGMAQDRPETHATTDGKLKSPEDLIRAATTEALRRQGITEDPMKAKANSVMCQTRSGKLDTVKTAEIRKIVVYTNGKPDWTATYHARNRAADEAERAKNRI